MKRTLRYVQSFVISLSLIALIALGKSAQGASTMGVTAIDANGLIAEFDSNPDAQNLVVVFLGTQCVISRRMISRLNELAAMATELNFDFYGLFPNHWDTLNSINTFKREYEVGFPLLLDREAQVAKRLKPMVSPESFVFDKNKGLVYRGRIDNRFVSIGVLRNQITRHDLFDAMQSVSQGRLPAISETEPVGCVYGDWDGNLTTKKSIQHGSHAIE
ncbi:MAG: redoxin domain-containing protein [Gammaproteobacteria bacterium]|nr:redoxin domain-containing protein [Gammaproteobacteria bacterium]